MQESPSDSPNAEYASLAELARRGEYFQALPGAKRLHEAYPKNVAYGRLYALCCRETDRKSKSSSILRRLYHSVPFDSGLAYDFGLSLVESQHDQEAIAILSSGLRLLDDDDGMIRSKWLTALGRAFWAVNHIVEALKSWREARDIDPNNAEAAEHLGRYGKVHIGPFAHMGLPDRDRHYSDEQAVSHALRDGERAPSVIDDSGWFEEADPALRRRLPFLNDDDISALSFTRQLLNLIGVDTRMIQKKITSDLPLEPGEINDLRWACSVIHPLRWAITSRRDAFAGLLGSFDVARKRLAFDEAVDAVLDLLARETPGLARFQDHLEPDRNPVDTNPGEPIGKG